MNRGLLRVVALAAAFTAAGCKDYLTGPMLDSDPNNPTNASKDQLLTGIQAIQTAIWTGDPARAATMWMQQFAGTDRQYITLDKYQYGEDEFTGQFQRLYAGGGLVDMKKLEELSQTDGDRVYKGVAEIWEAFSIGMAASVWGDIPYSEAVAGVATPKLDKQLDVYAAVQKKLDDAIGDLTSGQGRGPGSADLIYGGSAQKWIQAAHTLKARFYLHTAETDNGAYARALAEAKLGISASANDFRTFQSTKPGEENTWYQFMFRERDSYIRGGKFLVDLMRSRSDPRLNTYFSSATGGTDFVGASPGQPLQQNFAVLNPSTRGNAGFRQPMVTYAETQLIVAEAAYKTGDQAAALAALNAERQSQGLPAVAATVTGAALLTEILTEKYIVQVQNIDVWNDYKRTCFPALKPAPGATTIPARFLYGQAERNANPNIPAPSAQPARNQNDPNACAAA